MKLTISNVIFEAENLLNGKINQKKFTESEKYVLNFIRSWLSDQYSYSFETSGSTGQQKKIHLRKEQLGYSATQTINYLFHNELPHSCLLCINPLFIGGTQVITRALLSGSALIVTSPTSNPIKDLKLPIDLVSLVPLQVETVLNESPEKFELLKNVLIGGAELRPSLIQKLLEIKSTNFYQTYGMTETASHVAIKPIEEELYSSMGDLKIEIDHRNCLKLKGTVTNHEWIQTNDIVDIRQDKFRWVGRADWVINSGGMKISPENLERKINQLWPNDRVTVTSIPDQKLGEKVVLLASRPLLKEIKSAFLLAKHEVPKEEFILSNWPVNNGGKIDRLQVRNWARNQ